MMPILDERKLAQVEHPRPQAGPTFHCEWWCDCGFRVSARDPRRAASWLTAHRIYAHETEHTA